MTQWTYSVGEVADCLGVSERLVRSEIAKGTIRVVRLGRRVLIPASSISELVHRELPEWWKDGDDPNSDGPRDV